MKLFEVAKEFVEGWQEERKTVTNICDARARRENLSEKQLDKMVDDSFPASDPPSTY